MGMNSVQRTEPLAFLLPWLSGRSSPPGKHPKGARRVTKLEIVLLDDPSESETLSALSEASVASFRSGPAYFMDFGPLLTIRIE